MVDLNWLVAISSVYYQQDLSIMTPEDLMELCVSFFTYTPLLSPGDENILKITINPLDPTALMGRLGFDEDEKIWAGAIEETIRESNALTEYGTYFVPTLPDFSGDPSGPTDMEHGGSFSNDIDISGFTSPRTKNNLDLAAYAVQAWENNWGYVWGTYGNVLTESLDEAGKGVPIVALSYAPSKDEEILALNRGADQYWGLPIDNDILNAHLRSLLRRCESDRVHFKDTPDVVAFECGLSVNISIGIAFWKGLRLNLRPAPLSILVILASHAGMPVRKEFLYDRIWRGSYDINADEVLKHHISQLRKKLRELGADDLIKTVWGIGYMLRNETLLE